MKKRIWIAYMLWRKKLIHKGKDCMEIEALPRGNLRTVGSGVSVLDTIP